MIRLESSVHEFFQMDNVLANYARPFRIIISFLQFNENPLTGDYIILHAVEGLRSITQSLFFVFIKGLAFVKYVLQFF